MNYELRLFFKANTEPTITMIIAATAKISATGKLSIDAGFPFVASGSLVEVAVGEGNGDACWFSF